MNNVEPKLRQACSTTTTVKPNVFAMVLESDPPPIKKL
jgi:hypothetical protein